MGSNMTIEQFEEARKTLPSIITYSKWTNEQKQLIKELECIEIINSCLIYDRDFWTGKSYVRGQRYISDIYIEDLGISRVQELFAEQKEYFEKYAEIRRNVHTDSEGVSYNSVVSKSAVMPTSVKW